MKTPLQPTPLPERGFYAIADNSFCKDLLLSEVAKKLLSGGAAVIQLRAKKLSGRKFFEEAAIICKAAHKKNVPFIVNDRVDVALAVGADGVHVGQDDIPLETAKKIVGKKMLVGVSTHSLKEAIEAQRGGADYIGIGPVFTTNTKGRRISGKGIKLIRKVKSAVDIPVVAIGGITLDSLPAVLEAGADFVAMISYTNKARIEARTKEVVRVISDFRQR